MEINHRLVAVLSDSYSGPSSAALATLRVPSGVDGGWLIAKARVQCNHTAHSRRSLRLEVTKDGEPITSKDVPFVFNERGQGAADGKLQALSTGAGRYELSVKVTADDAVPLYEGMPHFDKRLEHLSLIKRTSMTTGRSDSSGRQGSAAHMSGPSVTESNPTSPCQ